MKALLIRFLDDINRLANCASFPRSLDVVVTLSREDKDEIINALVNFRRRRPSVKSGDAE